MKKMADKHATYYETLIAEREILESELTKSIDWLKSKEPLIKEGPLPMDVSLLEPEAQTLKVNLLFMFD